MTDKQIENITKANGLVITKLENNKYEVGNFWKQENFTLVFDDDNHLHFLKGLQFPERLSAIYHVKKHKLEFIFGAVRKEENFLQRKIEFVFQGNVYKTYYDSPTQELIKISEAIGKSSNIDRDNESSRNLLGLSHFLEITKENKHILDTFTLVSFFVEGKSIVIENVMDLAKHINFYMGFYDRKSPYIIIHPEQSDDQNNKIPNKSDEPSTIVMNNVNNIALDLLYAARTASSIRLKYIFFYQILEYYAYYHMDSELKRELYKILKNPDIIEKAGYYSSLINEELRTKFQKDDKAKFTDLIKDYVSLKDLSIEFEAYIDTYNSDVEFEGGYVLQGMSIVNTEKKCDESNIFNIIADRLDKIRNVLVHIREKREAQGILPTAKNDKLLSPYLYLIQRIAEVVAIKYDNKD